MFLQIDKQTTDCVTYAPFYTFFNHFWQSADAILEDVSVAETIV